MTTAIRNAHIAICQDKMRFGSKGAAKSKAMEIMRRRLPGKKNPLLKPYLCPVCRQFHLTRNKQS